jgi:hypothetical protein
MPDAVSLAGGFPGGSDQRTDRAPGIPTLPRLADGLLDRALGFRAGPDGLTQSGEDVGITLVVKPSSSSKTRIGLASACRMSSSLNHGTKIGTGGGRRECWNVRAVSRLDQRSCSSSNPELIEAPAMRLLPSRLAGYAAGWHPRVGVGDRDRKLSFRGLPTNW